MITFSEAKKLVLQQARSFGKEKVLLDDAYGRVIAEAVQADRDYPPFNRAAMDGYAIRFRDWEEGLRSFSVRETIFAGNVPSCEISRGETYKIMTGASVPAPADAIIRREDVEESGDVIECRIEQLNLFQNIARQGDDLKKDEPVCSQPVICSPAVIGMLGSLGICEVTVERRPVAAIITTGDEVVPIDAPVSPVQIRNGNRHVLHALLKKWNIQNRMSAHVPDQIPRLEAEVKRALTADILIMCGAVSAGDADHVPAVLRKLGAENIFHKVAIKPGKPVWFGKFQNGPIVFALPGNPLSCLVTFTIFIEPFLAACFRVNEPFGLSLPFKGTRTKKNELDEFFPVSISGHPSNCEIIPFNGSGDITAAIAADGFARHPSEMPSISNGTILDVFVMGK